MVLEQALVAVRSADDGGRLSFHGVPRVFVAAERVVVLGAPFGLVVLRFGGPDDGEGCLAWRWVYD